MRSKSGTVGYSGGRNEPLVPSSRTQPVETTSCPALMWYWIEPQVPTRTKVSTPACISSSTAIAVEGPPMPVEHTRTGCPSGVRDWATV
ncbi:hypothetical protein O2L01_22675 [Glycomyces lechevalierae]|uniref:Uncharacterized protein n=1 Tax=Glycomyces lechevalierae TaxID=256034 RepID=A0A9X3PPC1_9ACTN|nr:hypothetical protein [Glycomyces lechevalierae]MDA1387815.1 hypothetical protein [Glycomyces lechevalierae]